MSDFIHIDRRWNMSETDTHVFFVGGPFSQWFHREFVAILPFGVHGEQEFNCAEQYMMAAKAALFNDNYALENIMASDSPSHQKAWGRKVRGFDADRWNAVARDIVKTGNHAKFRQNNDLREFLLSTGRKTIVEGAWYDPVWGVKLAWDDPKIIDPANWQGTNWLGECLTFVREEMRQWAIHRIDPPHDLYM